MLQVSPSLLSADFAHLDKDIQMLNASEADYLHYDVMDGSFVPNISFGFPVLACLQGEVQKPFDVHLMVVQPERWISRLAALGTRIMTVHQEACPHLHRTLQEIHEAGMLAGIALNPGTPISVLEEVICDADLILIMTVNPGFGGQKFIPTMADKVRRLRAMITERHAHALIEVDGGVNLETGRILKEAGVDILVAGNTVFHSPNPIQTIKELKNL